MRGVSAYVRQPRGRDIYAACGQLAAKHEPNLVETGTIYGITGKALAGDHV